MKTGAMLVSVLGLLVFVAVGFAEGDPSPAKEKDAGGHVAPPSTRPEQIRQKLDKIVEKVDFKETPLNEVMRFLADAMGVNISTNWHALEGAGISAKTPISLELQNLPARTVLKEVIEQAGGGKVVLGYHIGDGLLKVTTADELTRDVVTRVYDVNDLVKPASEPAGRGHEAAQPESIEGLMRIIQETVDPRSWRDAGGSVGAIRAFGGKLIVLQTGEAQEQVAELLTQLRRKQK